MKRLRLWAYLFLGLVFVCTGQGCGNGGTSGGDPGQTQNPAPVLSSISPKTATAGDAAVTVAATGSGFIGSSVVEWNGTPLTTTFDSSTRLEAQVPAADLGSAGTANVAVKTPSPGGGTSTAFSFTISPAPNPTPAITSLSPSSAVVGGAALTLTVVGTNFLSNSQVLWNGNPRTTTFVSGTSLSAQIPASDLSSAGSASISVENPAPGGGASNSLDFTIKPGSTNLTVLSVTGDDLAWDASQKKIYVSVPSTASSNGDTITVVDPIAGSVVSSKSLASEPYGLAISDDDQYLYAATNGGAAIQRFNLPGLTPDIQWSLGLDPIFGSAYLAGDMEVQPGTAHTLAVSLGQYGTGQVAIFDDGVERSAVAVGGNSLEWKQDGSELYATYASHLDAPGSISTSDTSVYTFSVSPSGVSTLQKYGDAFRLEGNRLHFDPNTGYLYSDWGEVVNAANGIPVGNCRFSRPSGTYFTGAMAAVDTGLKRIYILLEVSEPDGSLAFRIQAFDETHFQLLSTIVIPNAIGAVANFIRWGQSGLAFVTDDGSSSSTGNLYILDGAFVNPSGAEDTAAGALIDPVPTLAAISPISATAASGAVMLTVTGHDFMEQPTVYWNGTAMPTTLVSSTEVQAQIPASDLAAVGQATITASNAVSGTPASNSLPFSINPAPPAGNQITVYSSGGNDLVWDANAGKIYVSMPGIQGDEGDSIGIIDPVAGTVTNTGFLGSDPSNLSISSDGKYLYAAMYGENAIQQLTLPDLKVNNSWNIGADSFSGPYYALALQAAPGAPDSIAVTLANFDVSPSSAAVVIYDGATQRPSKLAASFYPYSSLQWGGDSTTLYAVDQQTPQDFLTLGVSSSGAALDQHYDRIVDPYSVNIHYDAGTGLVYTDGGQAIQPSDGSIVGSYGASGITVPDSTLNRVFILGQTAAQTGTTSYTIESFDQAKFTSIGSITINNVLGTPTALIRWGTNGLAFTTRVGAPWGLHDAGPGQLYIISGNFVNPAAGSGASPNTAPALPVRRSWKWATAPGSR